jgi:hypothetical protein
VVYDTWRTHLEWPRLHLIDFVHKDRYFRPEHVCADCPYNSLPNKTGVRSHIAILHMSYISTHMQQLRSSLSIVLCRS